MRSHVCMRQKTYLLNGEDPDRKQPLAAQGRAGRLARRDSRFEEAVGAQSELGLLAQPDSRCIQRGR